MDISTDIKIPVPKNIHRRNRTIALECFYHPVQWTLMIKYK